MNKKNPDNLNLLFSAFLVTAFMVCTYFFTGIISDNFSDNSNMKQLCISVVFLLFGLILFYATRVGEGKQVWRFSPSTLIVMVIPALYIIISSVVSGLPYHEQISSRIELLYIAGVVLGYGIPYTFLSGYELNISDENDDPKSCTELSEEADELSNAETSNDEDIQEQNIFDNLDSETENNDKIV